MSNVPVHSPELHIPSIQAIETSSECHQPLAATLKSLVFNTSRHRPSRVVETLLSTRWQATNHTQNSTNRAFRIKRLFNPNLLNAPPRGGNPRRNHDTCLPRTLLAFTIEKVICYQPGADSPHSRCRSSNLPCSPRLQQPSTSIRLPLQHRHPKPDRQM
jgi:hypothetical protein